MITLPELPTSTSTAPRLDWIMLVLSSIVNEMNATAAGAGGATVAQSLENIATGIERSNEIALGTWEGRPPV